MIDPTNLPIKRFGEVWKSHLFNISNCRSCILTMYHIKFAYYVSDFPYPQLEVVDVLYEEGHQCRTENTS